MRDAGAHRTEATRWREEQVDRDGDEPADGEVDGVERGHVDHHRGAGVEREEHEGEYADEAAART